MLKIYSPNDEVELSMIRGLLDSEGIRYFVHNDHFGSMEVGPQIELFNKKVMMVAADDVDRAKGIITDFLGNQIPEEDEGTSHYSLGQKLRMIFEAVFFMWFMPGKKRRKGADDV
jgi:hypothetical protein